MLDMLKNTASIEFIKWSPSNSRKSVKYTFRLKLNGYYADKPVHTTNPILAAIIAHALYENPDVNLEVTDDLKEILGLEDDDISSSS